MSGLEPIPEENMAWDSYYRLYYDNDDDDSENNYTYTTPSNMAEGGYDPTDKTPLIPSAGDDDDGDDTTGIDWGNIDLGQVPGDDDSDRRNPFEPAASSTPAGGENIQLKTMTRLPPEKQGASDETSFITGFDQGVQTLDSLVRRELDNEFPNMSTTEIEFRYKSAPRSGGAVIEVRYHTSETWYRLYTKSKGDTEKTLNTALPKQIQQALGKSTDEEITELNAALKTIEQQEKTEQNQLRQKENRAEEAQRLRREMDAIRNRIQEKDNKKQELENAHGPLDSDAIQKLKDEKSKLETEHQEKRKELNALAKAADEKRKRQQERNKTRLLKRETERRLGELRARKDAIQPLDELKQKAAELNTKIKRA